MTTGNGRQMPWWVNAVAVVGLPGVLALLFAADRLELLPGQSPAAKARAEIHELNLLIRESNNVLRWTCHALWQAGGPQNEKAARVCWQKWNGAGRSDRDEGE